MSLIGYLLVNSAADRQAMPIFNIYPHEREDDKTFLLKMIETYKTDKSQAFLTLSLVPLLLLLALVLTGTFKKPRLA